MNDLERQIRSAIEKHPRLSVRTDRFAEFDAEREGGEDGFLVEIKGSDFRRTCLNGNVLVVHGRNAAVWRVGDKWMVAWCGQFEDHELLGETHEIKGNPGKFVFTTILGELIQSQHKAISEREEALKHSQEYLAVLKELEDEILDGLAIKRQP